MRGDHLATQLIHNEKGQINIVLNDRQTEQTKQERNQLKNIKALKQIDKHFSSFIGLESFKTMIKEIYAIRLINNKRKKLGLIENKQVLHMLFKGNPGTGKTTVARTLASLLHEMNILTKGHFIEADRSDLVGEYIGQTAQKTKQMVQKSLGGVLFIDEAYSLARGGDKDFGREAIDSLVKYMEDYHNEFVLILAGYPNEMDHFLRLNPGLKSRFPFIIHFHDYNVQELIDIAKTIAKEREYKFSDSALWILKKHLQQKLNEIGSHFSNGRYVRNVVENAIRQQAIRLLYEETYTLNDLTMLSSEDIAFLNKW